MDTTTSSLDTNIIRLDYLRFHDNILPKFRDVWKKAEENIGLQYDKHWDDIAIGKYKAAGRVPLNMPMVFPAIMTILGFEKSNRSIVVVEPVGQEDELNAEICNTLMKHVFDKNEYADIRDEVFEDGIIACNGIIRVWVEENELGDKEIHIKRIAYNTFLWDLNFMEYNPDSWSRWQWFEWAYLDDLILEFPDKEEELREIISGDRTFNNTDHYPVRNIEDYYQPVYSSGVSHREDKYIIKLIHDYKRVNKRVFELHDIAKGDIDTFDTKAEAETEKQRRYQAALQMLNAAQNMTGVPPQSELQPDEMWIIKPVTKKRIEYTTGTIAHLLTEPEILEDEDSEFIGYFAMFKDGKWWSLVDILKDTQREYDKMWAQIDFSIGTDVKTTFGMDVTKLHDSETPTSAQNKMAQGGVVFTRGNPTQVVAPFQRHGANPEYFKLKDDLKKDTQDTTGGRSFQALPDSSNQTKGGIEALQLAGSVQTSNYIKNIAKTDLLVGKRVVKLLQKHYNYEKTVKILGSELTEQLKKALETNGFYKASTLDPKTGWLKINPEGAQKLGDSSLVVKVTSQDARLNDKQYKLQQIMQVKELFGYPVPPGIWGPLMGLTPTEIQQLEDEKERIEALQATQMQTENKLKEAGAVMGGLKDVHKMMQNGGQQ